MRCTHLGYDVSTYVNDCSRDSGLNLYVAAWTEYVRGHSHVLKEADPPQANDVSVREHATFKAIFDTKTPEFVAGFECHDAEKMEELYPAGIDTARQVCSR